MNPAITQSIFGSKLLNAREKWMIVRYIKQNQPSKEKINEILKTLKKEDQFKKKAELTSLKKWNETLSKLVHGEFREKRRKEDEQNKSKEDAQADELLHSFFDKK